MLRILTLLFALVGAPAYATTVVALDVEAQALESSAFVEAIVGGSVVERGGRHWYTDTELQIVKVHAGSAPDTVRIRQIGGVDNGLEARLPGDARIEAGQHIAGFIREVDGRWYFTALAQSVWYVDGEGPKARVQRHVDGINFYERDHVGRIVPATESARAFDTLGALVSAVKTARFGGVR